MASDNINKENVENFIKKYVNRVINKQYEGVIPLEILDFQWFGKNLVVNVYLPEPPEEWGLKEVMRFWEDLTDVGEYARMIDHNLNSINFMHNTKKSNY
jgi:hypothetical protein